MSLLQHIAIIMDGNFRWSLREKKDKFAGHIAGVENLRNIVKASLDIGLEYLTVYAFSNENWYRSDEEIQFLMSLMSDYVLSDSEEINKNNIKVSVIGELSKLSLDLYNAVKKLAEDTDSNDGLRLTVAISYGSRQELVNAVNTIISNGYDKIDEKLLNDYLYTKGIPDPDLLIRTGGERRLSNFLLWQLSYTEIYFSDSLWPDFDYNCYLNAIEDFYKRERRYGKR